MDNLSWFEDYLHVEGEILRYIDPPKNCPEHHKWVDDIYRRIAKMKSEGKSPRNYTLVELRKIDDSNSKAETKLVWRKKEKANVNGKL